MKKVAFNFLTILLVFAAQLGASGQNDWENPLVIGRNKLKATASFIQYNNRADALLDNNNTDKTFSLNGDWQFHWERSPKVKVGNFFEVEFDDSSWDKMPVPGNWEVNGFGTPYYTNINYPFPKNPPFIDNSYNPVGRYRHTFEFPKRFENRKVILHLGAVSSAVYVWINGKKVGYSQGSKLPAEFDISEYLVSGTNLIALEVYRWSDGSYLEDQDFWRLSGIERDVYLIAKDDVYINNFEIAQSLDQSYTNGELQVDIDLRSRAKQASAKIGIELLDSNNEVVYASTKQVSVKSSDFNKINFKATIPNVKKWNAETPNLYTLLIRKELNGEESYISQQVGFRKIEIIDRKLCVNGSAVWITGVNRHDHNQHNGHVVSHSDLETDIKMMKQFNINTVRTAHYPNDPYFYKLCNEYGIYVIGEANIESHGMGNGDDNPLSNSDQWLQAHLERIERMVERDKNQPSIIIWSMGNEAGYGTNFDYCGKWLRERDPSRKTMYPAAKMKNSVDISCFGYPERSKNAKHGYRSPAERGKQNCPVLHHEYIHAMGNSCGNLSWYEDMMDEYPNYIGGCIWDWMDQGILTKDKEGNSFWAYGGDFGKEPFPTDANFCINGLMKPDMTPNPGAWEVKHFFQKIKFNSFNLEKSEVEIENRFDFVNLANVCEIRWQLLKDGVSVETGVIDNCQLAADGKRRFHIDLPAIDPSQSEYYIAFRAFATDNYQGIEKGHPVAFGEFELTTPTPKSITYVAKAVCEENANFITIKSGRTKYLFDKKSGYLSQIVIAGNNLLKRPMKPNFWRVPTDNDFGWKSPHKLKQWLSDSKQQQLVDIRLEQHNGHTRVIAQHQLPATKAHVTTIFRLEQSGALNVDVTLDKLSPKLPILPRFGVRMGIDSKYQQLSFYGKGGHENYCDRNRSAATALYQTTVEDQTHWYVRPQENGNKTEVRWLKLSKKSNRAITFSAHELLSVNASNYPVESYSNTMVKGKKPLLHPHQVERGSDIDLMIDHKQMGVGGDSSWGALPHREYLIAPKKMSFSFSINTK